MNHKRFNLCKESKFSYYLHIFKIIIILGLCFLLETRSENLNTNFNPMVKQPNASDNYLCGQYKTSTVDPDCGPGIKRGLGIKLGLNTKHCEKGAERNSNRLTT